MARARAKDPATARDKDRAYRQKMKNINPEKFRKKNIRQAEKIKADPARRAKKTDDQRRRRADAAEADLLNIAIELERRQ